MDYNFDIMKKLGCFVLLVPFLTAIPAFAQADFTIFGATQKYGKLNLQTATTTATTASSFDPATFGTFGVRIGHGRVFGGEHTIAYSPNFVESETKAIIYNSNFLAQVPAPKAKPYATAGMGTIFSFGTDDQGRPSLGKIGTKFAINYGGGVKVLPAGPVGIRFDLRGYLIPSAKFNVSRPTASDPLGTVKTESQNLNIFEAGFGIIFSFAR